MPQQIKKKSSPDKTNLKDKNEIVKKSRMKTAQDVINRIKWDSDFEAVIFFLVSIRNQLISGGLEPVIIHTKK